MKVAGQSRRCIRSIRSGEAVEIIDQTVLPFEFKLRELSDWRDCVEAIRTMRVRGAPLIGVTGIWAVALAVRENPDNEPLLKACDVIAKARPTAVNLSWGVRKMLGYLLPRDPQQRLDIALKMAEQLTQEDVNTCRKIGEEGAKLIAERYQTLRRPVNILTHCNAGWLATVDYGTALSPIYIAFEQGVPLHVWVDETRPRNQGLLTAWELEQQGIPHTLIVDNAGGQLMQQGEVDMVIVGADRITRRGDVANKIGTYLKALAAWDNDIPFYVAAPESTIDWSITDGKREIEIEDRSPSEVLHVAGMDTHGHLSSVALASDTKPVSNPAFDVTHNRFVTAIITETGIYPPTSLQERMPIQKKA
ncbi:MAG: S-methyl-5-thioribose-1-phosphate isomerase [Sutterella sp.]|nr:S-methyl-5-thioribose-1-phosphate isomerase [Sutterella sp.]